MYLQMQTNEKKKSHNRVISLEFFSCGRKDIKGMENTGPGFVLELRIPGGNDKRRIPLKEYGIQFPRTRIIPLREFVI